jgi:hypothetical protein
MTAWRDRRRTATAAITRVRSVLQQTRRPGTRDRATKLRAYFTLPSEQHYLIVWPEEQRIVRHSRMPNDQIATQVFVSGETGLDPSGIMVTVEEIYLD